MEQKRKKIITGICFSSLFLIYLLIGIIYLYCLDSVVLNFMFGSDTPRVLGDYTDFSANHYRTKVHPLYVLLIYPFAFILMFLGMDAIMSVIVLNALISTLNTYLVYKILIKLLPNKFSLSVLLTAFYAVTFTVLENLMVIESFVFSLCSILIFWCFFIYHFNNLKLNLRTIVILTLLGVSCFSILITNYIHFVVGLFFLIVFNNFKKSFKQYILDFAKYIGFIVGSLFIAYLLVILQKVIFPNTKNAFEYIINMMLGLFQKSTPKVEEFKYIDNHINGSKFLNILIFFFGIAFSGGKIHYLKKLTVTPTWITITTIVFMITLLCFCLYHIIKNKKYIAFPIILIYCLEVVLHLFYGNNELVLYINQSSFLLFLIIALGLSNLEKKHNRLVFIITILSILLCFIQTIVSSVNIFLFIKQRLGIASNNLWLKNARFFGLLSLILTILILILLWNKFLQKNSKKNLHLKQLIIAFILPVLFVSIYFPCQFISPVQSQAFVKVSVTTPDIVMMGMGQRKKYVLEKNTNDYIYYHYDTTTKTKTVILENLSNVIYDPIDYTIKCVDENKEKIIISENEIGIYLKKGNNLTVLDDSNYINIPNYTKNRYGDYMRILFYETMVNVLPNGFTPNYLTYGNFWYRDGAIIAMVLEATDNLSQMKLNIETDETFGYKIYDGARGGVNEPDNLGELLYMLSLKGEKKDSPIVEAILKEAERIKQKDNCIHGITDKQELYVYQTTWLKFGMEKLGLDSSAYNIKNKSDKYATKCWWYKKVNPYDYTDYTDINYIEKTLFNINKTYYPYLTIAELHYHQKKIKLPTELNYPISFEFQDWGLSQQAKCSPHAWTAAELFLYLLDY